MLDTILYQIASTRNSTNSFFWSDMLYTGSPYRTNSYPFNVSLTTVTLPTYRIYDFTSSNYYGLAVYITTTVNGQQVSFSKQKDVKVETLSTNPRSFVYDIFNYLNQQITGSPAKQVDPLLKQYPGNNVDDVKIATMVNSVKGFAKSCELAGLFGQGALQNFSSADDFLNKFVARYDEKAQIDIAGKKRDKATTPEAIARANADREKIQKGLDMVKGLF
jgi:hypothetical protein